MRDRGWNQAAGREANPDRSGVDTRERIAATFREEQANARGGPMCISNKPVAAWECAAGKRAEATQGGQSARRQGAVTIARAKQQEQEQQEVVLS